MWPHALIWLGQKMVCFWSISQKLNRQVRPFYIKDKLWTLPSLWKNSLNSLVQKAKAFSHSPSSVQITNSITEYCWDSHKSFTQYLIITQIHLNLVHWLESTEVVLFLFHWNKSRVIFYHILSLSKQVRLQKKRM